MAKSIIKTSLLGASFISLVSLTQAVGALDLDLDQELFAVAQYPMSVTTELKNPEQILILPQGSGSNLKKSSMVNQFSFKVYHGDAYNDLREEHDRSHGYILPEEDIDAYGFSVKKKF